MTTKTQTTRLQEVQLSTLRTMAVALAEMRPLALQIIEADVQMRTIIRILDEREETALEAADGAALAAGVRVAEG